MLQSRAPLRLISWAFVDDLPAVSRRIGLVYVATLRGMWSAMKNGEATLVVLFPARIQQEKTPTNKKAKNLDDVAETKVTNGARNVALDNAYQHGFVWPYQA